MPGSPSPPPSSPVRHLRFDGGARPGSELFWRDRPGNRYSWCRSTPTGASRTRPVPGALAQLVERCLCMADVRSSTLLGSTSQEGPRPAKTPVGGPLRAHHGHTVATPVCRARRQGRARSALTVLPPSARRSTAVGRLRSLIMGRPNPPVRPVRPGCACVAGEGRGRVRPPRCRPGARWVPRARLPAVAQSVGEESGGDQDHRVGGLGFEERLQNADEGPGGPARVGDGGCRGVHGVGLGAPRVPGHPGPRPGRYRLPLCPSCPGARLVNRADGRLPQSGGTDYLTTRHAEIYASRSRHSVVGWLWFLS